MYSMYQYRRIYRFGKVWQGGSLEVKPQRLTLLNYQSDNETNHE